MSGRSKFILINAAIQAAFAIAFMCNRNPELHWCAIAPIAACVVLLILKPNERN